jgi:hypothetical protein
VQGIIKKADAVVLIIYDENELKYLSEDLLHNLKLLNES